MELFRDPQFERNTAVQKSISSTLKYEAAGCNSGSIVFIKNFKYALHVSEALCIHLQEHYKL